MTGIDATVRRLTSRAVVGHCLAPGKIALEDNVPSQQLQDLCNQIASRPAIAGGTLEEQRAGMESFVGTFQLPKDIAVEDIRVGAIPADWVSMPASNASRVVLYLHGGGYVLGSRRTHR